MAQMGTDLNRQEKVAVAERFLLALRGSDIVSLQEIMTEDVAWQIPQSSPPPFGGRHQGREKILDMLSVSLFKPESGGVAVDQFIVEGDRVVAEVTITGVTSRDRDYCNHYVFIMTLRQDKIAEFKEHLDTAYANAVFWAD